MFLLENSKENEVYIFYLGIASKTEDMESVQCVFHECVKQCTFLSLEFND